MSTTRELSLAGVRVLDFTTHAVGPFATQILAGLGATVLKVEHGAGDPERYTEWPVFLSCNRGKHSVILDLRSDEDRRLAETLAAGADVLLEGYRPGVADRLGIGFGRVSELRPGIVYVSLPGWGSSGPYASLRGYDTQFRAVAGDAHLNRDPDGRPRAHTGGPPVFDFAAGMYAVVGILAALRDAGQTSIRLEVPVLAAGLAWNFPRLIDPTRNAASEHFQYSFRCSDRRWLVLNAPTDEQFVALCRVIGRPDLAGRADLMGYQARVRQAAYLNQAFEAALATRPRDEWQKLFTAAHVPAMPVREGAEVFTDPQVAHLDVVRCGGQPHALLPIFGLPQYELVAPPVPDADVAAVRARGWAGLSVGHDIVVK